MNTERLMALLQSPDHEGAVRDSSGRHLPYDDATGKALPRKGGTYAGTLTMGYGHTGGLSERAACTLLEDDIQEALRGARRVVPRFDEIGAVRQEALAMMAFMLGAAGLAGFPKMLGAVEADDWPRVGAEALDSEVGRRQPRRMGIIAHALRTGEWPA